MILADDLFAGAGGWDLGALDLGIHARGIELDPAARATRDAAGLETSHDDVWTFRPDDTAEGLIASPPCQTFSMAGSGTGRAALDDVLAAIESGAWRNLDDLHQLGEDTDPRTALVLTPLHFATAHPYRWLAWEQVPSVLPVWQACAEALAADGWHVWTGRLSSERYGVPQTRIRATLAASRDRHVDRPAPTHSAYYPRDPAKLDPDVLPWTSSADALGVDPSLVLRANRLDNAAIRPASAPAPTITAANCTLDRRWYATRAAAEAPWDPSVGDILSVEEAGILQTFPAAYPWRGTRPEQYLQAGNAVPPALAYAVLAEAAGLTPDRPYSADLVSYDRELDLFDLMA